MINELELVLFSSLWQCHKANTSDMQCLCVCVCYTTAQYHQRWITVQVPVVTEGELLLNFAVYSHRPAQIGLQRVHDLSICVFEGGRQFSSWEDKDNVQKRPDE